MRRTAASVGFLGDSNLDQPALIPALDRVSGEDVRVAPSKCYRGMVSDKDGPRARFLHVALTIKLSRQIYARRESFGKTMLSLLIENASADLDEQGWGRDAVRNDEQLANARFSTRGHIKVCGNLLAPSRECHGAVVMRSAVKDVAGGLVYQPD